MAKLTNGIMGAFEGRIGNIVGYVRKGENIIRTRPRKSQAAPSPAQAACQQRQARLCNRIPKPARHGHDALRRIQGDVRQGCRRPSSSLQSGLLQVHRLKRTDGHARRSKRRKRKQQGHSNMGSQRQRTSSRPIRRSLPRRQVSLRVRRPHLRPSPTLKRQSQRRCPERRTPLLPVRRLNSRQGNVNKPILQTEIRKTRTPPRMMGRRSCFYTHNKKTNT